MHVVPNVFAAAGDFLQVLHLANGSVVVRADDVTLRAWVDAHSNTVVIDGHVGQHASVSALDVRVELLSVRPDRTFTYYLPFACNESYVSPPDVVLRTVPPTFGAGPQSLILYHRNGDAGEASVFETSLRQQALAQLVGTLDDILVQRTFGVAIAGRNFTRHSPSLLVARAVRSFRVLVATRAEQTQSADAWVYGVGAQLGAAASASAAPGWWSAHAAFWCAFWQRSFVHVGDGGSGDLFALSQKYAVTRFVQAVQSRGTSVPIKFNGMAFVANLPTFGANATTVRGGPDFRDWGAGNWWQNMRL